MKWLLMIGGVIVGFLVIAQTMADEQSENESEAVQIPLKEIWAFDMPGTRDVRKIANYDSDKLVAEILKSLPIQGPGKKAKPGFAVAGLDAEALRGMHAILAKGEKPRTQFPLGSDVSLAFFSHTFGYYVHLTKVERIGDKIAVHFRFEPHRTKELTTHFAIVPLGELPPGKKKVEITRSPVPKALVNSGFKPPGAGTESQIVSQSFDFEIKGEKP